MRINPLFRTFLCILTSIALVASSTVNTHARASYALFANDRTVPEQAEALVAAIYGKDSKAAEQATIEALRRTGIPVVRMDGPLVGIPDNRALVDMPVYAEIIPMLAKHIPDSAWSLRAFTQLLIDITYLPANTSPSAVAEALGVWGKLPRDSQENQLAGSLVRALAAQRGMVFFAGTDPDQTTIDPLTMTLFISHSVGTPRGIAGTAAAPFTLSENGTLARRADLCDDINKVFQNNDAGVKSRGEMGRDSLIELFKKIAEHGGFSGAVGIGSDAGQLAAKVLTAILLRLGAELEIDVDKEQTSFKLKGDNPNDYSKHFTFTAHAKYNSDLAQQRIGCYSAAGLELPSNGAMGGYFVRWRKKGPDDKLTAATLIDGYKLADGQPNEFYKRLQTDDNGKVTLELMPARYVQDGDETRGVDVEAHYTISAKIEKVPDLPFSPSDVFSILTSGGDMETWVAKKLIDLALNAITRYNYPTVSQSVTVKYRGQNIYRIKGNAKVWMFYIEPTVEMGLLACEGLDKPFVGKGGILNIPTTGFGAVAEQLTGKKIPDQVQWYNTGLSINPPFPPNRGTVYPFQISNGVSIGMRFDRIPDNAKEHLSGVIGEVSVGFADPSSVSNLCDAFGLCDAHFKIEGVDGDPGCPNGDKIEYKLDESRKE